MVPDALVVGAGVIGAACARALARRGVSVRIIERSATAAGTSGSGEGNLLVSDKQPGPELELALHAARSWPGVAEELRDELGSGFPSIEFERKGGVVVAVTRAGAAELGRFAARQRAAGVDARPIDATTVAELEPHLTRDIAGAVHYPQDAQVQPAIVTEALLASARRAGARVVTGTSVVGALRDRSGRVTGVRTTGGDFRAGTVILAAGPWSGEVSRMLGAPLPVRPRRGVLLVTTRMPQRVFHKVYDSDYVGATQSGDATLQTSTVVESTQSGTVLIGSSRQQIGFDARLDTTVLRQIAAKAVALFPLLATAAIMRSYGGFRPYTPDHLPLIGEDPRLPGLWHATGHEGAGIGLAISTAELIADGVLGDAPELDPTPFSPARASLAPHLGEVE